MKERPWETETATDSPSPETLGEDVGDAAIRAFQLVHEQLAAVVAGSDRADQAEAARVFTLSLLSLMADRMEAEHQALFGTSAGDTIRELFLAGADIGIALAAEAKS